MSSELEILQIKYDALVAELSDTRQLYYEVISQRNDLFAANAELMQQAEALAESLSDAQFMFEELRAAQAECCGKALSSWQAFKEKL